MDEKKNATVEWFVNFAQMDLERLGAGDRAKLEVEAREYLFPSIPLPIFDDETRSLLRTKYRKWITPSDSIAVRSEKENHWISEIPERNTPEYWSLIVDCQKNVFDALKRYTGGRTVERSSSPAFYVFLGREKFEFIIVPLMEEYSDYAVIKLNMALDGLPVTCLQHCQSCRRIFFNPSQRKMKYCSTKCLWRFNTRKKREADRELANELRQESKQSGKQKPKMKRATTKKIKDATH